MQHLTAPIPSLHIHNNTLSPAIEAVVQQALAKDPIERFGSVQAFAKALKEASAVPPSAQATIYPFAQPAQKPILPTTPVATERAPHAAEPSNTAKATVAGCEMELKDGRYCNIPPIGRCTTCGRAFCPTHQAWESGQFSHPYVDQCVFCFAKTPAEVNSC